ncbi:hypothetical protein AVEN_149987-1 [Araneus ventricosus]|uniref:Uncharacterized protein n=1 Tax=Araneus ventricosus TaxID=182803 RepID=A0A4Y2X4I1_ARAVE|nr:hypothetical protein AVEN_230067-1 [Araneus ventricosus]GBO44622.1 hypothetical protein AVEN_149987-1 [Araneus ventricosus]
MFHFLFMRTTVVVSYSTCSSPQLDQVQESALPQKITNQRRTFKEANDSCWVLWNGLHALGDPARRKTPDVYRPFQPGPPSSHDEAA